MRRFLWKPTIWWEKGDENDVRSYSPIERLVYENSYIYYHKCLQQFLLNTAAHLLSRILQVNLSSAFRFLTSFAYMQSLIQNCSTVRKPACNLSRVYYEPTVALSLYFQARLSAIWKWFFILMPRLYKGVSIRMTETRFYEPARLSFPPKPLFLLKPLDATTWGQFNKTHSYCLESENKSYTCKLHE